MKNGRETKIYISDHTSALILATNSKISYDVSILCFNKTMFYDTGYVSLTIMSARSLVVRGTHTMESFVPLNKEII